MSSSPTDQDPTRHFVLAATPPLRALAIAAVTEALGAALLVGWQALDLPLVVGVVGALLLAAGTVLLGAAVILTGRLRTIVDLGDDAVSVTRAGRKRSLRWEVVREVTLLHPTLRILTADPADEIVITNPRGPSDPRFAALLEALRQRLDAGRGYRPLE